MNPRGIYGIWQREMLTFFREKPRIVTAIINPIFWLLTFGVGLGATVHIEGINYEQYIFAGILVQTFFVFIHILWRLFSVGSQN